MRVFRRSTLEDIDEMMTIVTDGQALLKSQGIDQWQKGYPNRELLVEDVREGIGYVVEDEDRIAAMCAVTFTDEESYRNLDEGTWLTPEGGVYATIHRGAVARACQGQGYPAFLFSEVGKLAEAKGVRSVRADTHPENRAMQKALEKSGFVRCGVLTLIGGSEDGDRRLAYEKILF